MRPDSFSLCVDAFYQLSVHVYTHVNAYVCIFESAHANTKARELGEMKRIFLLAEKKSPVRSLPLLCIRPDFVLLLLQITMKVK